MFDGIYRIAFTGSQGSGFGVLVFHTGAIAGADVAGSIFDGSYSESAAADTVDFHVTMNAPAGVTPVQTGIPLVTPMILPISGSLAIADVNGSVPTLLQTPLGPVNILFKKIRDLP